MKKLRLKQRVLNFMIIILIVIIVLLIFVLFYCDYYVEKNGLEKYLKLKLNGKKEIVLNYKDDYKDKGATATYNGKNITKSIKVKTNFDIKHVGEYKYTYTVKYKKLSKSIVRKVKIVDKNEPKIELIGENEITIYNGTEYKDPGFKANDEYDGDITNRVKVNSNVDTSKVGEYKVIYDVSDSSGNKAYMERIIEVMARPEGNASGVPVLMYHFFYDKNESDHSGDGNWKEIHEFENEVKYLVDNGYYFPSWQEIIDYLDGKITLPQKLP